MGYSDAPAHIAVADPEVDLFAGMKKKKKKVVAIDLDDAPPPIATEPTPEPVDTLEKTGPATAVESPQQDDDANAPIADEAPVDEADLFADMKKKKKKKKEIPLDLVSSASISISSADVQDGAVTGESSTAAVAAPDGLDGLVKKKKSRKPASDFAKELDEMEAEADEAAGGEADGDLGEDPFAKPNGVNGVGNGDIDPWVTEKREATYPEVSFQVLSHYQAHA